MPHSLSAVFGMHAYVAAEAYAQAQTGESLAEFQTVPEPAVTPNGHSAFFMPHESSNGNDPIHPYRDSFRPLQEFGSLGIPMDALVYAFTESEKRDAPLSILRHHHFGGFFEVTQNIELPSLPEEEFFGYTLRAHVRSPRKKCLPSHDEISWIRSKAIARPDTVHRLALLGFSGGDPAFIQIGALAFGGSPFLTLKFSSSENMSRGLADFLANSSAWDL